MLESLVPPLSLFARAQGLNDHPFHIGRATRAGDHVECTQPHSFEKLIPLGVDVSPPFWLRFRLATRSINRKDSRPSEAGCRKSTPLLRCPDLFAFADGRGGERGQPKLYQDIRQRPSSFQIRRRNQNLPGDIDMTPPVSACSPVQHVGEKSESGGLRRLDPPLRMESQHSSGVRNLIPGRESNNQCKRVGVGAYLR